MELLWIKFAFGLLVHSVIGNAQDCMEKSVAKYNVTFTALWSKKTFPKQYPLWRPPPSWSAVMGRTHNSDFVLWREGQTASPGMKEFSEVGKTEVLDQDAQGQDGVLDTFKIPALGAGVGTSQSDFFVDSNHPSVSLASHIVPSPDWFVGVDSVMLCRESVWIRELSVELGPWDAGTDKGFTFTAPNWADVPQLPISQITAHFPDHPANSFFYPDIEKLPPLAKVTFRRVGTYQLIEGTDEVMDGTNNADNSGEVYNSFKNFADQPNSQPNREPIVYEELPPPKQVATPAYTDNDITTRTQRRRPRGRKSGRVGKHRRMGKVPNGRNRQAATGPGVNCEVSAWADWAPCSKTCGFGSRTRRRYVAQKPEGSGRACPVLVQTELCGSMRSCGWKHFRFGTTLKN